MWTSARPAGYTAILAVAIVVIAFSFVWAVGIMAGVRNDAAVLTLELKLLQRRFLRSRFYNNLKRRYTVCRQYRL